MGMQHNAMMNIPVNAPVSCEPRIERGPLRLTQIMAPVAPMSVPSRFLVNGTRRPGAGGDGMWRIPLIVTTLFCLPGVGLAQDVVIATEGANPPFNFIDDFGTINGFEREVGNAICQRKKLNCA